MGGSSGRGGTSAGGTANDCSGAGADPGGGSAGKTLGTPRCAQGVRTGVCCNDGVDEDCSNDNGDFCGRTPQNTWTCGNI